MCNNKSEKMSHIVSECENLAQKEHKKRKRKPKRSEKWYEHAPESVTENEDVKILWNVFVECLE